MERLTKVIKPGKLYGPATKVDNSSDFTRRYQTELKQLGLYEDTKLSPRAIEQLKKTAQPNRDAKGVIHCNQCSFCQTNDRDMVYCHAWHRETESYGFCYRAVKKKEVTPT